MLQEVVQEPDLVGVKLAHDQAGHGVQVGPLLQQPGPGLQIGRGGGGEGERSGVLVDPQGQQGGLVRGQGDPLFLEQPGHHGGAGPHLLDHLHLAADVVVAGRVVIVDVDLHRPAVLHQLGELADPAFLPGIHQDQPADLVQIHVLGPLQVQGVGGRLDKEILEPPFLGSGKHGHGLGIEQAGRQHGRQSVEIGVLVGRDYGQVGFLFGQWLRFRAGGGTGRGSASDRSGCGGCRAGWWRCRSGPASSGPNAGRPRR